MPRRFPIFQFPNPPLITAMLAGLFARVARGRHAAAAGLVEQVALLVWAYQEVTAGANWFRRLLGLAGGAVGTLRLANFARRPAERASDTETSC